MSDVVAVTAFGKSGQHTGRMWCTVAALACRNHFVFLFVAGDTGDVLMFCISLAVQCGGLLVARSAHLVGCVGCVGNSGRHMSLVTALAVGSGHLVAVRFMTLCTLRHFAMNVVAETACKSTMLALHLSQLDDLLGVAGETLFGYVIPQLDDLGCVRIGVTAEAVDEVIMRLAAVALTTDRNDFFY